MIHRDVKPSNLLLDNEGTLWLTDFGLARCSDELTMTATGMLLGTPRYVSPEQASVVSKPVDARSNVYSLGASLYELATGKPVYDGEALQRLLAQIRDSDPVIVLRNLEGLAHAEVAERMGRSEGDVRMLWVRALARLRRDLKC